MPAKTTRTTQMTLSTIPPDESHSGCTHDLWSDWLLRHRHGSDGRNAERVEQRLRQYADKVIEAANLKPGMTAVDIGTGDGLLALRAIETFGASLTLWLTDISQPLLERARKAVHQRGVQLQCRFLRGSADNLAGIEDRSVDAVMMRAVLAYVADKPRALQECWRVLKPHGRLSLAEPVLREEAFTARALRHMVESGAAKTDPGLALLHRWKSRQYPDTDAAIAASPLTNYSERDLVRLVQHAGFRDIHMEFHIDVVPAIIATWEAFLESSPHPWAPTTGAILEHGFSADERRAFEAAVRPTVEKADAVSIERIVYLSATR
jgi:arsenite methyltransferase